MTVNDENNEKKMSSDREHLLKKRSMLDVEPIMKHLLERWIMFEMEHLLKDN